MKIPGSGLVRRIRAMGGAFVGVVSAELSALVAELSASGRSLFRSLVIFGFGFALAFWTLGLLVYFLIELLALGIPRWGAVGIVFAFFLITASALIAWSVSRIRRIESPVATVDRRLKEHLGWWQERIAGRQSLGAAAAARAASGGVEETLAEALEEEDFP